MEEEVAGEDHRHELPPGSQLGGEAAGPSLQMVLYKRDHLQGVLFTVVCPLVSRKRATEIRRDATPESRESTHIYIPLIHTPVGWI